MSRRGNATARERAWRTKVVAGSCVVASTLLAIACSSVRDKSSAFEGSGPALSATPGPVDPNFGGEGGLTFDAGPSAGPPGPKPTFGPTTTLADAPPPISGGTLIVLSDDKHAAASDPDRNRIYLVDLNAASSTTIQLSPHDEPGRLVEDAQGQVHVVLRSGGALVTIDETAGTISARRAICGAPRGIDYDAEGKRLVVACESGEVYSVDPSPTGAVTLIATLAEGLRDVLVIRAASAQAADESIYVSRFRTAELVKLTAAGNVVATTRPTPRSQLESGEATLAWRLLSFGPNAPLIVHQFSTLASVAIPAPPGKDGGVSSGVDAGFVSGGGGYGSGGPDFTRCSSQAIVRVAISGDVVPLVAPDQVVLPVDVVRWQSGLAVLSAGNGHTPALPQVFVMIPAPATPCAVTQNTYFLKGQGIALATTKSGSLWAQSREPAQLENVASGVVIPLAPESREDTGHAIFHSNSGAGIACASCHGEGGDDSHVWTFSGLGKRRTPSLRGTIANTAPYHWDGDMKDIGMLADEVMTSRMNGPALATDQKSALQSWLFAIPPPALLPLADAAAVARGKALFESNTIACSSCHSGPQLTSSATVDVGTGQPFQVPPLVGLHARAPYLHDGCAATLADRFGACGGTKHGNTVGLMPSDISDLVAYLESL